MSSATIQKIEWIKPIEDADLIEEVGVLGWCCVVKKEEKFKVGDKIVYVEIDSVTPEKPEFEFLRIRNFRVKTIRLKKVLSQGLVLPLSVLPPEGTGIFEIGDDVSEILGITHYEKPISAQIAGQTRGNFPTNLIHKTDEKLLQNFPRVLEELRGIEVCSTVKLNGTSGTFLSYNGDFQVCSRNLSLKINDDNVNNVYVRMAEKYNIKEKLAELGNFGIQGEICGPGIQDNQLCLKEIDLFIFNIWDIDNKKFMDFVDMPSLCNKLGIRMVPVDDIFTMNHTLEQLLEKANGIYDGTNKKREGIVIRPVREMHSNSLRGRMSFKILSNKYLISEKD